MFIVNSFRIAFVTSILDRKDDIEIIVTIVSSDDEIFENYYQYNENSMILDCKNDILCVDVNEDDFEQYNEILYLLHPEQDESSYITEMKERTDRPVAYLRCELDEKVFL